MSYSAEFLWPRDPVYFLVIFNKEYNLSDFLFALRYIKSLLKKGLL